MDSSTKNKNDLTHDGQPEGLVYICGGSLIMVSKSLNILILIYNRMWKGSIFQT